MAVLALGSLAKAAGSAQGSVRRVENRVRRQSEHPGSGYGAPHPGLAMWGCPLCPQPTPQLLDGTLAPTLGMRKRGTTAVVTFPVPQPQVCLFWRLQEFLQVLHCRPGQSQAQGSTWVLPHLCSHSFASCPAGACLLSQACAAGNWHSCNWAVLGPGLTLEV